ncbi:MAG: esterase [Lachnospiraceae bacterium]|nr:esterase [Lachnospiraceae bacterium]
MMNKTTYNLENKECILYSCDNIECILIQPVDEHDTELLDKQVEYIVNEAGETFALAALRINDWNGELSPWKAEPVFGKESFKGGADQTLSFIKRCLIPDVLDRCGLSSDVPIIIGGYSLAALFSLWCGYETDRFYGIAAASPSVWFPGWIDYAKAHDIKAGAVYLSLGDKEEKTKNKVMARVGDCIREQYDIMSKVADLHTCVQDRVFCGAQCPVDIGSAPTEVERRCPHGADRRHDIMLEDQKVRSILEWNEGNHFRDSDIRTGKAFVWCLSRIKE